MANKQGQDPDYLLGAVADTKVDQGDGTFAPRVALGAEGAVKVWGRMTVAGPLTARAFDAKRKSWMARNKGPGVLYVGGAGTTSADGIEVLVDEVITIDHSTDAIGVDASVSLTLQWLEERNA